MSQTGEEIHFVLVCEGPADARTVELFVRQIAEAVVTWLRGTYEQVIEWSGLEPTTEFSRWTAVRDLADEAGIPRLYGQFDGEFHRAEAKKAHRALLVLKERSTRDSDSRDIRVCFLIRDTDDVQSRNTALKEARDSVDASFEVAVGTPHTKRECWVLAAFEAANDEEKEILEDLRSELGFWPTQEPHRLTASETGAKKNAVRVLEKLTDGNVWREHEAIRSARVDEMRESKEETMLADFISEAADAVDTSLN